MRPKKAAVAVTTSDGTASPAEYVGHSEEL